MIVEYYRIDATDTDVLGAPSRLAALPYNGTLIVEMQSQQNDGTNFFQVTIQLPDGSTPLDLVTIPSGATDTAINLNDKYTVAVPATSGGHILIQATENGTAVLDMRCTLMP
jgi:hypothetical protein